MVSPFFQLLHDILGVKTLKREVVLIILSLNRNVGMGKESNNVAV